MNRGRVRRSPVSQVGNGGREQEYSQPGMRLQYGIKAAKMIIKYKMFINGARIA
jgi:hypothetical protein